MYCDIVKAYFTCVSSVLFLKVHLNRQTSHHIPNVLIWDNVCFNDIMIWCHAIGRMMTLITRIKIEQ